jgi:aspartyl aminopeptidase
MTDLSAILDFLSSSPTPMHFVSNARHILSSKGFVELRESESWEFVPTRFFVVRNERSLIAINKVDTLSGIVIGSNIDCPGFHGKPNLDTAEKNIQQARIVPYSDTNWCEWLDRRLKAAGQVIYEVDGSPRISLFNTPQPIGIIPSLAVHLNREAGLKPVFNLQDHFVPILSIGDKPVLKDRIAESINVSPSDIVDFDIAFYDANPPKAIGVKKDLIAGARLTNMAVSLAALFAFVSVEEPSKGLNAFVVYDEVLSGRPQSNFLPNILDRIGCQPTFYRKALFLAGDSVSGIPTVGGGLVVGAGLVQREICKRWEAQPKQIQNYRSVRSKLDELLQSSFGDRTLTVAIPVLSRFGVRETMAVNDILGAQTLFTTAYTAGSTE